MSDKMHILPTLGLSRVAPRILALKKKTGTKCGDSYAEIFDLITTFENFYISLF